MKIRIKALTHKMKNRVTNHGDVWNVRRKHLDGTICITIPPGSGEDYTYGAWVKPGEDIEIVEELE